MRRIILLIAGIWVLNPFMLLLYLQNRPLYGAFVAVGATAYSCIDWDANGSVVPGVCDTPAPELK